MTDKPQYTLGIDIGGTFTDLSLLNLRTQQITPFKVPSTPASPSIAVRQGITELMSMLDTDASSIVRFVHGTTIALNATIERRGAAVGLLVSAGNRDILEIARLAKGNQFNLRSPVPAPLIPRRCVVELPGRVDSHGNVVEDLRDEDIDAALDLLTRQGVEAYAVCLLNAHRNPVLERRVEGRITQRFPGVHCSRSTALWPEIREYERAVVACLNAYVQPTMSRYVSRLQEDANDIGLDTPLYITRSNGGVMRAVTTSVSPVHTMLSGPASGVVGAAYVARLAGVTEAVTCDIGGTSADVALIRDGEAVRSTEARVGDFPIAVPSVDVFAVGAGGGSIAWFDSLGILKVGPRSAGAVPGPACYGAGGSEPTVTDAYVVCGYINPDNFAGGRLKLDRGLAEQAIATVAERLGVPLEVAAYSILSIATANMVTALLPMMTKRGIDPRDYTLIPFGGAGATHACLLAEELMIPQLMIPPSPGTLCALGAMIADLRADYIRSLHRPLEDVGDVAVERVFLELEEEARGWLTRENADIETVEIARSADMRYSGQAFEIEVECPLAGEGDSGTQALAERFHRTYHELYQVSEPSAKVELINLRVRIAGKARPLSLPSLEQAAPGSQPPSRGERYFHYAGSRHLALVYSRADLRAGHRVVGPCVVEQPDTTTVIAPGFDATIDTAGILMIHRSSQETVHEN